MKRTGRKRRHATTPSDHRQFFVRQANLGDIGVLVQQRSAMWKSMGVRGEGKLAKANRDYKKWASKRLRNGTLRGWLAQNRDGTIAGGGCLWLQPIQPRPGRTQEVQPYLLSMYTSPAFRGRGVASKIVREAAKWARKNGYPSLRLHASEMGRGVYRNLGFKRTWEMRLNFARHC